MSQQQQQRFRPLTKQELLYAIYEPDRNTLYGPIGTWDVSQITDMSRMFRNDISFNENINDWDTSNVTNMGHMFENATGFNQPLDRWNTSRVVDTTAMFRNCFAFNQNIENWDVSNVTDMSHMFDGAISFNQPLNQWDPQSCRTMAHMFEDARAFNQPLGWDVSEVRTFACMFQNAFRFNQNLRVMWGDTPRADALYTDMFYSQNMPRMRMRENFKPLGARTLVPPLQLPPPSTSQPPPPPPPQQTEADRQRRQAFLEQQRQLRERTTRPPSPSPDEFPVCCICQEQLNNRDGPEVEGSNDNDVIRVCDPSANHFMHRGCARQWANPPTVDVVGQMGITEWGPADRQQRRANTCPICTRQMNQDLDLAPRVEEEEILRESAKRGGKRRRRTTRRKRTNKTRKTNKKKKSLKTIR